MTIVPPDDQTLVIKLDEPTAEMWLRSFTDLLQAAKRRQSEALAEAAEQSLEIVPRVLRGSVRKILFG